jgi:2-oxoglutarate ferredoxin oxidoreductase subunit alpha
MTVEINYSDNPNEEIIDENNRRYSSLAWLLRGRYLIDVDCWSKSEGQPIKPGAIEQVIRERINSKSNGR